MSQTMECCKRLAIVRGRTRGMQAANTVTSEHSQRPAATRGGPGGRWGQQQHPSLAHFICDVVAASPERRSAAAARHRTVPCRMSTPLE